MTGKELRERSKAEVRKQRRRKHDEMILDMLDELCGKYQKMLTPDTNSKNIRLMKEGDLVEFIHAVSLGYKPWCDYHCKNEGDDGCDICIRKWLSKPPKEV